MSSSLGFCHDCEQELTADNTAEFGGFDSGNYLASRSVGFGFERELFVKCDDCFQAEIDRAIG
jgi:hypothetical protein